MEKLINKRLFNSIMEHLNYIPEWAKIALVYHIYPLGFFGAPKYGEWHFLGPIEANDDIFEALDLEAFARKD